jgi:import inner membrane translocase subunit TIM54
MSLPTDASTSSAAAPKPDVVSPTPAPAPAAAPVSLKPKSGTRVALEYTGIPPSWFDKRPKLPGRNWLIFWSVLASGAGYYAYDRRECARIRAEYVARVAPLADAPLHSLDLPRKVTVYGAKWPGDEDAGRALLHFRKYVKVRPRLALHVRVACDADTHAADTGRGCGGL